MKSRNAGKEYYLDAHKAFEKARRNREESSWMQRLRADAISSFAATGFPTIHDEDWKYFDVSPLAALDCAPVFDYKLNGLASGGIDTLGTDKGSRLTFINGQYSAELSTPQALPAGATVCSLAAALTAHAEVLQLHLGRYATAAQSAFNALNMAFLQDGAFIYIPDGIVIEEPINLCFASKSGDATTMTHPRNLIVAGKNSQVTIIESYVCARDDVYFTNSVTEVVAGDGASIDHYKVQMESEQAFHVGTMQVQTGRDCNFASHSIALGGKMVRNNANAVLGAEGTTCTLNGLVLGHGEQIIDNHTIMDHAQPRCNSHELYANILDGKARGVFNGKIFVRPDAQKTDAKQSNRNLLLSRDAIIDTKPQLEIFADDVKCTHGATIGQLDEDALFYLRARGIDKDKARDILTYAFASEIIDQIKVEPLRDRLSNELLSRLARGR